MSVSNCSFTRLDGNAVLLSGFNRNATLDSNTFRWIGGTAMASWGGTDSISDAGIHGFDATPGDFPRNTLVQRNVVSEIGLFEKQSSAWFQAQTAQTTLERNILFNGARAGVNFNDGMGGGSVLDRNLVFNFCRESTDHGPFNSWDRNMYLVRQPNDSGAASTTPLFNQMHHNMLVANWQAQEAIDTDDGSAYLNATENFLVYGNYGQKTDFAGHDNYQSRNIYAYISPVCYVDLGGGEVSSPAHRNLHSHNVCVQPVPSDATYAAFDCRNASAGCPDNECRPVTGNNTVYNPTGNTSVCGMPLQEWQALGHDVGTKVVQGLPSDEELIGWAEAMLL